MTGDHLLSAPVEVACGKMDRVGEVDDLTEKIRSCAETLDDAGNLLAARTRAPVVIGCGGFANGGGVFCDFDLCFGFRVVDGHSASCLPLLRILAGSRAVCAGRPRRPALRPKLPQCPRRSPAGHASPAQPA